MILISLLFQIINWISENVMSFDAFDQIQEFILGVCFYSCDLCQFCMQDEY